MRIASRVAEQHKPPAREISGQRRFAVGRLHFHLGKFVADYQISDRLAGSCDRFGGQKFLLTCRAITFKHIIAFSKKEG